MCEGAQHAWLHACIHWRNAVSADGAHHHKAALLHHLHCVSKEFGSLTCNDVFGSIANVVQCALSSCVLSHELYSSST